MKSRLSTSKMDSFVIFIQEYNYEIKSSMSYNYERCEYHLVTKGQLC